MPKSIRTKSTAFMFLIAAIGGFTSPAWAQSANAGATLEATKTLDICTKDGQWLYSGEISVWNSSVTDTLGFQIVDHIQSKVSGPNWTDRFWQTLGVGDVIRAGTTQETATVYKYSFLGTSWPGDIRNVADVTITNHSGSPGIPTGPSPKATYTGPKPPLPCANLSSGCTYTRGYWTSKPGVVWPSPYSRDAQFYYSGSTAQQVLETPPKKGNPYLILGPQFIAAELNVAKTVNPAVMPTGVKTVFDNAAAWFNNQLHTLDYCTLAANAVECGYLVTWAGILDDFNNGVYPGGPPHCADEATP